MDRIPGLHDILNGVGLIRSYATPAQMQFGKNVHRAAHLFDTNNLNRSSISERVRPRLEAWERFKKVKGFQVVRSEVVLYHPLYRYGTTIDKDGIFSDGSRALVEIKTGFPEDWNGLQLAGQEIALNAWPMFRLRRPRRRMVVHLKPDANYSITYFDDRTELYLFPGYVSDFNWRVNHNYAKMK